MDITAQRLDDATREISALGVEVGCISIRADGYTLALIGASDEQYKLAEVIIKKYISEIQ